MASASVSGHLTALVLLGCWFTDTPGVFVCPCCGFRPAPGVLGPSIHPPQRGGSGSWLCTGLPAGRRGCPKSRFFTGCAV